MRGADYFLIYLILLGCSHGFVLLRQRVDPRTTVAVRVGINNLPEEVSGLLNAIPEPLQENPLLGGLLILVTGFVATRPPARLLNDKALADLTGETFVGQQLGRNKNVALECVYKASRDGWSATVFHDKVDTLGSGIVAAKPAFGGRTFGGFNPSGWRSTDDYTTATTAFLWYSQGNGAVKKFPVIAGSPAVFDYATSGPCFGASDLLIGPPKAAIMGGFTGPDMEDRDLNSGSLKTANCLPGQAYDTDSSWPLRGYRIPLQDVEVYCLVQKE